MPMEPQASLRNGAQAPNLNKHDLTRIPDILPRERVFPIQVGGKLFNLSGVSISSDAPSYFSQHFLCQINSAQENKQDACANIRTLYIDRDPNTFADIVLHLQGYHIHPRDGTHFVRLFSDALFYHLPRLISQLYDESVFISIGQRQFQIPRGILTDPNNSPNYFSLCFGLFFSKPEAEFPGHDRESLIRPPSIEPPCVPNRSAETFAELLHILKGYPINVRNEAHRAELLRDARYFHFRGVEQKLIPHSISFNSSKQRNEITLRLENIEKSGISINHDQAKNGNEQGNASERTDVLVGWVNYARPYVHDQPAELVLEIGDEATCLHFTAQGPRIEFFGEMRAKFVMLFEVIATKLGLSSTTKFFGLAMTSGGVRSVPTALEPLDLRDDLVTAKLDFDTAVTLDGKDYIYSSSKSTGNFDSTTANSYKRRRTESGWLPDEPLQGDSWTIRRGQWRLRTQQSTTDKSIAECVMEAVCLEAVTSELGRNQMRQFLGR